MIRAPRTLFDIEDGHMLRRCQTPNGNVGVLDG